MLKISKNFLNITFLLSLMNATQSLAAPIVIVSVEPLSLLVREICSSDCEVWTLVPKGASEHSWQPGPKDLVKAKSAVASIGIGLKFDETWFKKISANPKSILWLGDQLSPMDWWSDDMSGNSQQLNSKTKSNEKSHSGGHHDDDHHHHTGGLDPHVWTEAGRMMLAAKIIGKHLSQNIPAVSSSLIERSSEISQRIAKLQLEVDNRRKFWKTRPVVVFHDVAGYFARRFNLPVLAVSTGSGGHDYSAKMLANVANQFKDSNVAGILVEREDGASKNLAKELKSKIQIVDFAAVHEYKKWDDWYLHIVSSWELVLK